MLDADLAEIYQVETKRLNEAVKHNIDRFPPEFMFRLTQAEYEKLRSQFVTSKGEYEKLRSQFATSKNGKGGRRYLPFAFTEHGVIMLSSVLNSKFLNLSRKDLTQRRKGAESYGRFVIKRFFLVSFTFHNEKYSRYAQPGNNAPSSASPRLCEMNS